VRPEYRRRLVTITVGSLPCAVVGAVAVTGPFPIPTKVVCGCLLAGSLAAVVFWAVRLRTFPAAGPATRRGLLTCYALGVGAFVTGLAAGTWGLLAGVADVAHGLFLLLFVIDVGEHFGVRWVDGQGRFFAGKWLGGAARVGLSRPDRRRG
jgi:hypothetical protein